MSWSFSLLKRLYCCSILCAFVGHLKLSISFLTLIQRYPKFFGWGPDWWLHKAQRAKHKKFNLPKIRLMNSSYKKEIPLMIDSSLGERMPWMNGRPLDERKSIRWKVDPQMKRSSSDERETLGCKGIPQIKGNPSYIIRNRRKRGNPFGQRGVEENYRKWKNTIPVIFNHNLFVISCDQVTEPVPTTSSRRSLSDEEEPLPAGWNKSMAPNGRVFYIDHNSKTTTWVRSWSAR